MRFIIINLLTALRSLSSNKMRAGLTVAIISLGIMSLIGMVTALSGIENALKSNFASIGANTFNIKDKTELARFGGRRRRGRVALREINYQEARQFKETYNAADLRISINYKASGSAIARYRSQKTNPQVDVFGGDENYLLTSGQELAEGRNITEAEVVSGTRVAIIGHALKLELFGLSQAIDKRFMLGSESFQVIGVLEEKGTSFGSSGDNVVIVPVNAARALFPSKNQSFVVSVNVPEVDMLPVEMEDSKGVFRLVRSLGFSEEDDFEILSSENLTAIIAENTRLLAIMTFLIGGITLLGAGVGLMNIMLVTVKERTKEIGTRKALGAKRKDIALQFVTEALLVSQMGGLLGVLSGIALGNVVSLYFEGSFIIPWGWAIFGFVLCSIIGLVAGAYPAVQAAKQDPIIALRYE